ncbi:MAG: hypothetical protein PHC34_06800 [Candidatus Gastranaerophilales bacterium]|nr:hypothetical protein [Candidatus Gastranaerophilales bacterium]
MSNLQNSLIQAIGYSSNTNNVSTICALLNNNTTSTTANNVSFAALLAQLNRNLDSSGINSSMSSFGYSKSTSNYANQTGTPLNIITIAQKIKDDNNEILGIDEQVAQYLLENYGGSKSGVIMSLSGAQSLPLQMTALQDTLFKTIVSKISTQVRNTIYSGQDLSSFSSDDMSTDSSVSDSSSDIADI